MSTTCVAPSTATPQEIGQRLADTFEASTQLPKRFLGWMREHDDAIKAARALLEAPLTADINAAFDDATRERQTELTSGEWCDLLEHQVDALRELEGADSDIAEPDAQARQRLVRIAGMAIAFADFLDRWKAKQSGAAE